VKDIAVDTLYYKRRLLRSEKQLVERLSKEEEHARETVAEPPGDWGDLAVSDVVKEEEFSSAEDAWKRLRLVREPLQRIEKCVIDGKPIDEKRLKAVPWTPYCLEHERWREGADASRMVTL
jgi:DnaK suppressor protein